MAYVIGLCHDDFLCFYYNEDLSSVELILICRNQRMTESRERNKAPAELQISAEQILLEAYEGKDEPLNKTKVKIADLEELHEYQRRTREGYENALRRNRLDFGQWMRYAQFEIDNKELRRARSIFERALDINAHHVPLWLKYIDAELKTRNINHARNLFDRATTLLPRVDKIWFRYVQTEETLQNIIGTRNVFKRWLNWEPDTNVWDAYINFEKRYDEFDNVRKIFNRYVVVHPYVDIWLKWVKFEQEYGTQETTRQVYTFGIDSLKNSEKLIVSFAKWEGVQKEWERARAIFKFGLSKFPDSNILNEELAKFEKQYGDKDGVESSILAKRKQKYEKELESDPNDYDTWWAYLQLLDNYSIETRREAFEKAVSHLPGSKEKVDWKRYIFLWIKYAVFEELNNEVEKSRHIYKRIKQILPKSFTFSKIWILYSNFEIRQGDLAQARKILGMSIGQFPKHKTFKYYIQLEIKLKEFDRVRKLYNKYLESFPESVQVWNDFADLETALNDIDRARAIYRLSIENITDKRDNFEIWLRFIDFEIEQREYQNARQLYEDRLSKETNSTKLWIKFAMFELTVPTEEQLQAYNAKVEETGNTELEFEVAISEESKANTRAIFERALTHFKNEKLINERVMIFEAFKQFEEIHGSTESQERLNKRFPTVVRKIKELQDGSKEEYFDYVFPDDKKFSKFLENAKKWAEKNK